MPLTLLKSASGLLGMLYQEAIWDKCTSFVFQPHAQRMSARIVRVGAAVGLGLGPSPSPSLWFPTRPDQPRRILLRGVESGDGEDPA